MTDCPECAKARASKAWPIYRSACAQCTARAIAQSPTAWHALHPNGNGKAQPLRLLIAELMPTTPTADARRMVWEWWQHEHRPNDALQ